jgi:hypothetical protein
LTSRAAPPVREQHNRAQREHDQRAHADANHLQRRVSNATT